MWFELAELLGQPVRLVKQNTSSSEFVKWQIYKRQKAKAAEAQRKAEVAFAASHPSMDHQYMAQIAQWVAASVTRKLESRDKFIIPFAVTTEADRAQQKMSREELVAQADDFSKMKMFAILGTPENFEGFKT